MTNETGSGIRTTGDLQAEIDRLTKALEEAREALDSVRIRCVYCQDEPFNCPPEARSLANHIVDLTTEALVLTRIDEIVGDDDD